MPRLRSLAPTDAIVLSGLGALIIGLGLRGIAVHPWPDNWDATDYSARFVELAERLREGPLVFLNGFPGTHGPLLPLVASSILTLRAWANPYWPLASIELVALAGTVALLYVALRRSLSIPTALAGTLVYAATLNQIYWSTQILYEGFGYLLTPCLLLMLERDARRLTPGSARAAGLFVGLATLTRLNFAIAALATLLLHVLTLRLEPDRRWRHLRALFEPIVLTTGVWYTATLWHTARYYTSYATHDASLGLFWNSGSTTWLGVQRDYLLYVWDRWGTGAMVVLAAAVLVSPWAIVRAARDRRSSLMSLAAAFTLVTLLLCLAITGKTERYLTPALLPSLLVVAGAIAAVGSARLTSSLKVLVYAAAALQLAAFATQVQGGHATRSALLQGPAASSYRYWEHSNAAAAMLARTAEVVESSTPLLFVGHGSEMDNVTVRYWNLAQRTHLTIEYGWDPLDPVSSTASIRDRIARARYVLFAPARTSDGEYYRHASDQAAATLQELTAAGRAEVVVNDENSTLYRLR